MNPMIFKRQEDSLFNNFKIWCYLLLSLGILVRLFHYFYNRSLWMDETYLSSSLLKMNYHDLATKPLDYQQKAPIGFLWIVKTFLNLFGKSEPVLRLTSLLCGIVSLFVFIPVAKYFTGKTGTIIGLLILAFAPPLIFHAVEIKQYQAEMLACLLVFYSYIKFQDAYSFSSLFLWGLLGGIIVWFSYSSIFILMGIAAGVSCMHLFAKDWNKFFRQIIPFSIWLISFSLNYFAFTHKHAESKWIVYWFDYYHTFMPVPPKSIADLHWYVLNLHRIIDYPLGMVWKFYNGGSSIVNALFKLSVLIPLISLFIGLFSFSRKPKVMLVLCFPFVLLFLASGLKLYPLTERFWVFISPLLIIIIANGGVWLMERVKWKSFRFILLFLMLAGPLCNAIAYVAQPDDFLMHKRSFQRQALDFVNEGYRPGDLVYVYWNDLPGFKVYKQFYPLNFNAIEGIDHRYSAVDYNDYLDKLKTDFRVSDGKKRIWFIYNDYYRTDIGDKIDEPKWYYLNGEQPTLRLLNYLSTLGKQAEVFSSFDVHVTLITLKK